MLSTQERPPQPMTPAPPPAEVRRDPPGGLGHPPWRWVDDEEVEPPRPESGWLTRFLWAKTVGGW